MDNYLNGFMDNKFTQLYDVLLLTENFKVNQLIFDRNINFVYYLTSLLGPLMGDMLNRYLQN